MEKQKSNHIDQRKNFNSHEEYLQYLEEQKTFSEIKELRKPFYAKHQFWAILVSFLIFLLTAGLDKAREVLNVDELKDQKTKLESNAASLKEEITNMMQLNRQLKLDSSSLANKNELLIDTIAMNKNRIEEYNNQIDELQGKHDALFSNMKSTIHIISEYVDQKGEKLELLQQDGCMQCPNGQTIMGEMNRMLKELKNDIPTLKD